MDDRHLGSLQSDQWDEATRGKKMSSAAGRVIFKYQMPVMERFTMKLPRGAEIIRMADQGGMFWLWAVVDTNEPDEERKFWSFKTGGGIPDGLNLRYIGLCRVFIQMEFGLYIFEEVENRSGGSAHDRLDQLAEVIEDAFERTGEALRNVVAAADAN